MGFLWVSLSRGASGFLEEALSSCDIGSRWRIGPETPTGDSERFEVRPILLNRSGNLALPLGDESRDEECGEGECLR
jgi:hypothetical protein